LRESERRWHDLSEALPQLVWTCNSDGRCDFLSQQWITYTGRSEAEQLDYGWLDQVHPEDRDRLTTAWDEAVASVTLFDIEFRIRRADGVYRWFKTRAVPVRNADGQVAKWFGSNTDIEDLKSTTEALRQSEEKHRTIVETAMEAIAIVDAKARIIFVNERWLEMFGYNPEEAVHMTHFDLVFPEDMAAMKQRWEFRKRGRKESYELRLRRKDGSPVWVLAGVAPNFGPEGEFIGTLTMLADVTERKRAEEALKKSHEELETRVRKRTSELTRVNKELQEEIARREKVEQQLLQAQKLESIGTLAGGIAHDINNILGPIVLNSEMALLDLPKGSAIRNNLEVIYQSGLRGKDLTRQMLLFGRKSENKQELLTLSHLVKETFRLLRSSIPTTVQMKFYLKTKSDPVYADASQLQQVIMNLCTNAAYAMRGTKGSIEISLQGAAFDQTDLLEADMQPGEYLVLSIKDTGPGMSEEVKKRIFEPFFTTKPVGEGTGLGLSVAYGIVKSHGGNITVDSKPGKGSIFKVYLPMAGVHVSEKAEPAKPIPKGKERVLFVDDEEMIVQSMRNMLERLGYKVTTATDSENALRLFSAKPSEFDLVITDQTMPRMSGEDLGKKLMRIRPDIPVILCTGYSDLVSSEKATSIGFRGFLMKPFSLRESAELVRRVLDQSRSE
jgi:PAS domain S-box-containing protein